MLIYSSFALKDVVDTQHYNCWCLLVRICELLCHPILSRDSVDQAHILLVEFCKQFESLYGPEHCTPNMHMSLHLMECLLDFGPLPAFSFWRGSVNHGCYQKHKCLSSLWRHKGSCQLVKI